MSQTMRVFVLNMRGEPLMPCKCAKARHLLKDGKAFVACMSPFTIQLKIATGENRQPITLGIDPGAKTIGLSASTEEAELYSAEVEERQDIPRLNSDRRELRRARRYRKTRYRAPRFSNRVGRRNKGWLAPSLEHKVATHHACVGKILKILPVTTIVFEEAKFDIQRLQNLEIAGIEYQNGPQRDFDNVRAYVLDRDGYTCQHCKGKSGDPRLHVHHLQSARTGGDAPNNLITLCTTCHKALHAGTIKLKRTRGRSYKGATHLSILRKAIVQRLKAAYPELEIRTTYGYITKRTREEYGIAKSHRADAFCIAGNMGATRLDIYYFQKQIRRHNRKIHNLTIYKGGKRKLHQAPYEVEGFRLFDKVLCEGYVGFILGRRTSGYFKVCTLGGTVLSTSIHCRKLRLLERRTTFLTEVRYGGGASSPR